MSPAVSPNDLANVVERTGRLNLRLDRTLAALTRDIREGLIGLIRLEMTIPETGPIATRGKLTPEGERLVRQLAAANCALTEALRSYDAALATVTLALEPETLDHTHSTEAPR